MNSRSGRERWLTDRNQHVVSASRLFILAGMVLPPPQIEAARTRGHAPTTLPLEESVHRRSRAGGQANPAVEIDQEVPS